MKKFQIKSVYGKIIFEYEKEDNSVKDTVEEAVKRGINLCEADLHGADLSEANLCRADLSFADLHGANLYGATLCEADLHCALLYRADLSEANLSGAYLRWANLSESNLSGAYLLFANLTEASNIPNMPMSCPPKGSFIAWKKVNKKLVKLEIPEDARRSSATTSKCRCDKAKVLAITDLNGENPIDEIVNSNYDVLTYKVGQMVYPDSFDENRWRECSHGIHFFVDKQEAIDY